MLKTLFRMTPELLFLVAILLLAVQLLGNVGGTWAIARAGIPLENFEVYSRLIGAFVSSLYQPAILFGMGAIVAILRSRSEG